MLERLIEFVLASKLRSIVRDFDRESFSVSLWQGRVVLQDLRLSPEVAVLLGAPLALVEGAVERAEIVIPWRALATQAVEVSLEGLSLLFSTTTSAQWTFSESEWVRRLREAVDFEDERLRIQRSGEHGSAIADKVLKNLVVNIRNVHIRLETSDSSLGFVSESIQLSSKGSIDCDFCKQFSARALYWYLQPSERQLIHRSQSALKDMRELTCRVLCGEEHLSVICPLSLEAELTTKTDMRTTYSLQLTIKDVDFHLTQCQYQSATRLSALLAEYTDYCQQAADAQLAAYRSYLRETHSDQSPKAAFKLLRTQRRSPEDQRLYDAIVATTPHSEVCEWLLELHGEAARKTSRLSWLTGLFADPPTDPAPTAPPLFDCEVTVGHVGLALEGRRTTCSEYIYRVVVDVDSIGFVSIAESQRMALRVESLSVKFQDPISLEYIRLFQFTSRDALLGRASDQLFLTITNHATQVEKYAISLEVEQCRLALSANIVAQIQSFFAVPAATSDSAPLVQLQRLWDAVEIEAHCKPCDVVFLLNETAPSEHLLLSLGAVDLVKIATIHCAQGAVSTANESLVLRVAGVSWVLVSLFAPPAELFSLSQELRFEVSALHSDLRSIAITAAFPSVEVHAAKHTMQKLRDLTRAFADANSTDAAFVDTRKKEIMRKKQVERLFDLVWRNHKQQWLRLFTVWQDGYLYFFGSAEETCAAMYFSGNNCSVRDPVTEEILTDAERIQPLEDSPPYQLLLMSNDGERTCRLGFDSLSRCKDWFQRLQQKKHRPTIVPPVTNFGVNEIRVDLTLPSVKVVLECEEKRQVVVEVENLRWEMTAKGRRYELRVEARPAVTALPGPERYRYILAPVDGLVCSAVLEQGECALLRYSLAAKAVEVAWNHTAVSSLLRFLTPKDNSDSSPAPPTDIQLSGDVSVSDFRLLVNNDVGEFTLAEVIATGVQLRSHGSDQELRVSSLLINDLSNYPESAAVKKDSAIRAVPLVRISGESPLTVVASAADVSVRVAAVAVTYLQQPFLRVLNTLVYHIPAVLFQYCLPAGDSSDCGSSRVSSADLHSFSEEPAADRPLHCQIDSVSIRLPPHYTNLESNDLFEVNLCRVGVSVKTDRSRYNAKIGYCVETEVSLPVLSATCQRELFISETAMKLRLRSPVLTKQGMSEKPADAALHLSVQSSPLLLTVSQAQYSLFLRLVDLNLAYDDHMDRAVLPGATPPQSSDVSKFVELAVACDRVSLLLRSQRAEVAEVVLAPLEVGLEMFVDGYQSVEVRAARLSIFRPQETAEKPGNPFALSPAESEEEPADKRGRLPAEIATVKGEDAEGDMIDFRMRKDRLGSKTMTSHLRSLRLSVDLAFLQEVSSFLYYAFPDYSSTPTASPFAYMSHYRPTSAQTFDTAIDTQWLSPLLDFELIIKDSEFVLPTTLFAWTGKVVYNYLKQDERKLQMLPGKQVHVSTHASLQRFSLISRSPQSHISRCAYATTIVEPVTVEYACSEYRDKALGSGETTPGLAVVATVSKVQATMTVGDIEQMGLWARKVQRDAETRKSVIEELAGKAEGPGALEGLHSLPQRSEFSLDFSKSEISVQSVRTTETVEATLQPRNSLIYGIEQIDFMLIDDQNGLFKPFLWAKGSQEEYKGESDPSDHSQFLLRVNLAVNLYNPVADV